MSGDRRLAHGRVARTTASPEETRALGAQMARTLPVGCVLALEGDLGSGKTEFVRGFVGEYGCNVEVTSPTFSILNTYRCGDQTIHHFDLYRIKSDVELAEIGFDEYLFGDGIVLIEWPDRARSWLPPDAYRIVFEHAGPTSRQITYFAPKGTGTG